MNQSSLEALLRTLGRNTSDVGQVRRSDLLYVGMEFCVPTPLDGAATVALVDSMEEIGLAGDGEGLVCEALRSHLVSALSARRMLKMWWWG